MGESTDNKNERKKLSLQGPVPVEVKQSFSNRRSKTVQVEHKISRGRRKAGGDKSALSSDELNRRAEALRNAQDRPKEETLPPLPKQMIQKPALKSSSEPLEPEAAPAPAADAANLKETGKKRFSSTPVAKRPAGDDGSEKQKKTLRLKGDDRRRQGKLTISEALVQSDEDEDSSERRGRSLAALKRAREKERQQNLQKLKSNEKVIRDVIVPEAITVAELANRMAERVGDVVKALMKMDVMATPPQIIDADTAELIVAEFGHRIKRVAEADVEDYLIQDNDAATEPRPPVVSIMGHVDHGKTTLLDTMRQSTVAAGEVGGITQHIGAYQVTLPNGHKITFLDTPGHQAFTAMRARGANITDIAVIVIAADDGLRDQTIESINHAKAAKTPMIIAITKCDKPDVDIAKIYNELLNHEIVTESLGGDVLNVEISAEKKINIDKLQEAILLQAELGELKANPNRTASGIVVESLLDKGRGNIATLLVQNGTLAKGDIFVAGSQWGRVRALIDAGGKMQNKTLPSTPIEVLGLQGLPMAGDRFDVVENEAKAREIVDYRQRQSQSSHSAAVSRGVEHMFSQIQAGEIQEIAVLVKADVHGSLEALKDVIEKTSHEQVKVRILHAGVGAINQSDVSLAETVGGFIIGFNVRANAQARKAADDAGVEIRYYPVIYQMGDDLEKMVKGMLAPEIKETFLGTANVKEVFHISKLGKIAGCEVTEGVVRRAASVRLLRDDVAVYQGTLKQLKRFKDEVREVASGFECGMALENYDDIKPGDKIECFETSEVAPL